MTVLSALRRFFQRGARTIDPEEADLRVVAPVAGPEMIAEETPPPPQPHAAARRGPPAN